MKTVTLVIMAGVFFTSCNNTQKIEPSSKLGVEKTIDNNWVYGKTFTQEGIVDENPELGGSAFLKFASKENIELKTGDIVAKVKATFEGNTITLEDKILGTKRVFTIVNNTYLEENRIKWTTK